MRPLSDQTSGRGSLRGPWLTSVLGLALLCGLPVVMLTGLVSNAAYNPWLDGNVQIQGRGLGPLDFYVFNWPAHPVWLYAVNQGIHVSLGLALIPVVLAKQWSVLPRPLTWPPARSVAHLLEQVSLVFLIGGIWFELVTGVLFIEYWFPFRFDFTAAHFYGAWVFFGALLLHVAVRMPRMRKGLATRRQLAPLRSDLVATRPDLGSAAVGSLVPAQPATTTMSRRTLLGTVAFGSLILAIQGIAQDIGGPLRRIAFMLPRSSTLGSGPNGFPVNGTFASLGLAPDLLTSLRVTVQGTSGQTLRLSRDQLLAMPQHTYWLPIACREGWSTTQRWTGVRLRDLAEAVGMPGSVDVELTALDGAQAALASNQVAAASALLALTVNGAPLSPDHGFPARVIVPAEVAMNCLKWVHTLSFSHADDA
jgi:DMSO/TMAO reductase YedYZ molybdopterin-dependent catalytic subunit